MYLTIRQQPKLSKDGLLILRQLSHTAKSLYYLLHMYIETQSMILLI